VILSKREGILGDHREIPALCVGRITRVAGICAPGNRAAVLSYHLIVRAETMDR